MSGCQLETEKPLEALRQLPLLRKLKVGVDISSEPQFTGGWESIQ